MCQLDSSQHQHVIAYQRWLDLINQYSPSQLVADDFLEAANAAIQSGKWTEAVELLGSGYCHFSRDSSYLGEASWLLINLQHPEPALKYLQQAEQQGFDHDRSVAHHAMLALAYFQNDQISAAIDCYRDLLSRIKNQSIEIDMLHWPEEFKQQLRQLAQLTTKAAQ
jgi:tetratricopeptide (TPR) repeat protein